MNEFEMETMPEDIRQDEEELNPEEGNEAPAEAEPAEEASGTVSDEMIPEAELDETAGEEPNPEAVNEEAVPEAGSFSIAENDVKEEVSLPEGFEGAAAEESEEEQSIEAVPDEHTVDFIEADGEEMVEQLSLLDGELPHLEAANAPNARTAKAVLEGLLFIVGDEGITLEQAATALDITPELAAEYFDELMKEYTDEERGIEIASYGGVYRFLSKAFVHDYAKRLFQISKHAVLSQAALETLAIIAYKQPITRVEIEEIRGVGADMMLRKLLARDLIKESGRSEAAGRPILYEVTDEFMNSFKLLSLKELPELSQFDTEEESEELFGQ